MHSFSFIKFENVSVLFLFSELILNFYHCSYTNTLIECLHTEGAKIENDRKMRFEFKEETCFLIYGR